jgi:hypothetical protein
VKVFGAGFEQTPAMKLPLTEDKAEIVLDLAALKTPPGEYLIALYGGAVPAAKKVEAEQACQEVANKQKAAVAALAAAAEQAKKAAASAEAKGIVDIVVSEPIAIRVQPAESK